MGDGRVAPGRWVWALGVWALGHFPTTSRRRRALSRRRARSRHAVAACYAPRRPRVPAPHRRRRRTMKQGHRPQCRRATTNPRRGEKAAKRRRKFFGRWVLKIGRWVFGIGRWVLRPRLGRRVLGAAWALGGPWEGGGEVPTRFGGQGGGGGCREAVGGGGRRRSTLTAIATSGYPIRLRGV